MPQTRKKSKTNVDKIVRKLYTERKESIYSLHKVLNRIDVEKDAVKCIKKISEGLAFFRQIADMLFGKIGGYDATYSQIEDKIEKITETSVGYPRMYNTDNKYESNLLPDFISHSIQDSGLSPIFFNKDIIFVINPGSFLDPCKRTWDEYTELYGFDKVLTKENTFNIVQLPVNNLHCKQLKDNKYEFVIDFGFKTIYTLFDSGLLPVNTDAIEYFSIRGNSAKNEWFNKNKIDEHDKGRLLILCKELGDTLQALYAKFFIMEQLYSNRNKLCLFTCDKLLARRCQLLGVPVILNGPDTKFAKIIMLYIVVPR